MPHICVLGGGIIGLSSAIALLKAGHKVTLIAAHLPGRGDDSIEYTSPWAGAHWRTHATSSTDYRQQDWDIKTYKHRLSVIAAESSNASPDLLPSKVSGLRIYPSYLYWDEEPTTDTESFWWAPRVRGFETLSPLYSPLVEINKKIVGNAGGVQGAAVPLVTAGAKFDSVAVNVPQHLLYLLQQATELGVVIVQRRLDVPTHLAGADGQARLSSVLASAEAVISEEAAKGGNQRDKVDVFVNAMGLAAGKMCGDENVVPVKGQTVLVKGEATAIRTRQGKNVNGEKYIAYCIPRPGSGTTILGGSKEEGNWDGSVDDAITGRILRDCRILAPELRTGVDGCFEVVSAQAGLRPARKGGARMEREAVEGKRVVHAYGHSGAGYQNSIGAAEDVVKLVQITISSEPKAHL